MATSLDTKLRRIALSTIKKYGLTASFAVKSGGTYSPTSGSVSGESTATYSVKVTPPEPYETKYQDGDLIRAGDARIYIADQGLAFVPAVGQRVTIDGDTFVSVSVNAIRSGELVCLWEVALRR